MIKKICNTCNEYKQETEFNKNKGSPDGFSYICRKCASTKNKKRYLNIQEELKNYSKKYRKNNYKIVLEKNVIYRHEHPDKARKYRDGWRFKNVETIRQHTRNRRAKLKNSFGTITKQEWQDLLETYNYTCLKCKRNDVSLSLDHVVPIVLGGTNTIDNAQPLCKSCNSSKGIKIIDYR